MNLKMTYDLQDKFKGNINYKTQISTLNHNTFNLGTEDNPQFII